MQTEEISAEETLAMMEVDGRANNRRFNQKLQNSLNTILNDYAQSTFGLLKEAKLTVHRLQLKVVRKERVIKKLQDSLKKVNKENETLKEKLAAASGDKMELKEPEEDDVSAAQLKEQVDELKEQVDELKEKNKEKSRLIREFKLALADAEENKYAEDPDEADGEPDADSDGVEDLETVKKGRKKKGKKRRKKRKKKRGKKTNVDKAALLEASVTPSDDGEDFDINDCAGDEEADGNESEEIMTQKESIAVEEADGNESEEIMTQKESIAVEEE